MRVKICGITTVDDARYAEAAGADAIGVILFSESPRCVNPGRAEEIFRAVGPFVTTVAVTHTRRRRDLDRVLALRPAAIQISHPFNFPARPAARILRVARPGGSIPVDADALVIDQSQGTGRPYDPDFAGRIAGESPVPVILAGGLTPENVAGAIRSVRPYAVDVASGVEVRPGVKDSGKVRAFIQAARGTFP